MSSQTGFGQLRASDAGSRFGCGSPMRSEVAARAIRIAGVMTLAVTLVGALVSLTCAGQARRWLDYPFTGLSAEPGEALAIFLHNARGLIAIGGLLLIAQSAHWNAGAQAGPVHQALQRAAETVLAVVVAANLGVVGAGLGAYGARMAQAMLPHGPAELAGYSLALALYTEGRSRPLAPRPCIAVLALAAGVLAAAAVLEVYG